MSSPLSALALHATGRNMFNTGQCCKEISDVDPSANNILLMPHNLLDTIDKFPVNDLNNCCLSKYSQMFEKLDVVYIRNKSLKDNIFWKTVRQFRITGSRCYSLYTYNKTPKTNQQWAK